MQTNLSRSPRESGQKIILMKFGGTSMGTPKAMAQAVDIVRQAQLDRTHVIVVVSALATVTNLLLDSAAHATHGDIIPAQQGKDRLRELHAVIADSLVQDSDSQAQVKYEIDQLITSFANLCQAIAVLGESTPRALDAVAALGERMSVRLMAAALTSASVPARVVEATQLIVTDDRFQNAYPDIAATTRQTRAVLPPILAQDIVPVVTGFIAATPDGITTTLGRGGSDYTAGILGAVLPADEVWIWTDVDGVMSADPRLVPDACTLPEITYREIAELAYYGAKVLHPKTIRPLVDGGIGLRICNTFNPQHPGTRLVPDDPAKNGKRSDRTEIIKAVTAIRDQRLITVEGRGMLGVPGVAARTFAAVASTGTSVPLITQASSEQSICFAVPAESAEKVLAALQYAFAVELADGDIDRVWATPGVAIITVVGVGMIHTPGVAGRIFSALGGSGVNVIAIAQGSSEVSISLVVASGDVETAVQVLHRLILNGRT